MQRHALLQPSKGRGVQTADDDEPEAVPHDGLAVLQVGVPEAGAVARLGFSRLVGQQLGAGVVEGLDRKAVFFADFLEVSGEEQAFKGT